MIVGDILKHYLLKGPCEVVPEGALWLGLKQLLKKIIKKNSKDILLVRKLRLFNFFGSEGPWILLLFGNIVMILDWMNYVCTIHDRFLEGRGWKSKRDWHQTKISFVFCLFVFEKWSNYILMNYQEDNTAIKYFSVFLSSFPVQIKFNKKS